MSLYEGMFLIDNRQANRDWDGSLEQLQALLAKHGGQVERSVKWGERRLAYEIKGNRRGTYVLVYFRVEGDAVARIYREVELSEIVLRALILKVSAIPPDEEMHIGSEAVARRHGFRGGPRGRGGRGRPGAQRGASRRSDEQVKKAGDDASASEHEENKVEAKSEASKEKAADASDETPADGKEEDTDAPKA